MRGAARNRRPLAAALALILAAGAAVARAESRGDHEREFSKTVAFQPGQRLEIEHSQGALHIGTHALPEVRIHARIAVSSSDDAWAQRFFEGITISVEETGSAVWVRTKYPDATIHMTGHGHVSYAVDIDITMPETMPLAARNKFGNLDVAGLKAPAVVSNANGEVSFIDGKGKQRIENAFGAITVERNAGDVDVSGSNGAVVANAIGGALSVRNRFGSVEAKGAKGPVSINASNGAVLLEDAPSGDVTGSFGRVDARSVAGELRVQNSNGEVVVSKIGGRLSVRNSFAAVDVADVGGAVDVANSNGAVRLRGAKSSATLKTSFGNVEAAGVPGDVTAVADNGSVTLTGSGGAVDARGSFGKITVTGAKKARIEGNNSAVSVADVAGPVSVSTSFGLVEAARIQGDLSVDDSNGAVKASAIGGGAKITTSFAGVTLDGAGGRVDVDNQNGSVDVRGIAGGAKCSPVSLKSSFGPIRLSLPEDAAFTVNAHTSFGKITTQLPLTISGSPSSDTLTGRLGDGRCPLTLENSNGSIELLKGR